MSKAAFDRLNSEVLARDWTTERMEMNEMADIYEGKLPKKFEPLFPKNTPKHLVQVIPLAWDDLATTAGRIPDLRGKPKNKTRKELDAVGLQEKIAHSYLTNAMPTGKRFMKDLAWWLQAGRAVAIVTPDRKNQRPSLELRDPRSCYPGVKRMVNNTIVELSDLIFKYELPLNEARKRGLAPAGDSGPDGTKIGNDVEVLEYIDENIWMIVSEHGQAKYARHDLGMVPGWVFQSFAPNSKAGKSRFRDQVALMVAISRLITAKVAYADRLINPILWTKGLESTIELGPYTINKLGPNGEMGQINPPTQFQVDRDIQILNQFSRVLNRNPEVRQGEVQSKGSYTSAKTLEQLADSIDTVIGGDWDTIGPGIEKLIEVCFRMDVKLWPKVEKTIEGTKQGKRFFETYIPEKDIAERFYISADYGFGVGGYQGFLMHLQAKEAETMSTRHTMENMPGVSDVDDMLNEIELEKLDRAGIANLEQMAATGQMDMVLWAKVRKQMAEKGLPLYEAMIKYQELLAEQAAAAAQSQGDVGGLTAPGPEELPAEEALPGLPPSVLAGV